MLSDATSVHSVCHFGCNVNLEPPPPPPPKKKTVTAGWSVCPLWVYVNFTLTSSLDNVYLLVDDSTALQKTTIIWKIPAQTDVTCSGVLLWLCIRRSILLISSTMWCSFCLISAALLSESNRKKPENQTARMLHPSQVA